MRNTIFLYILTVVLTGCTQNSGTDRIDKTPDNKIRKQAIRIAENYALKQLKDGKKSIAKNGPVILRDSQKIYVIDPAKVFVGQIDDNSDKDAIVSIDSYRNNSLDVTEHLILLKTNGRLMLIKSIESDMKILGLKDRVITAEIHTKPRNNPLYNCSECKEVVKYQYKNGDLIRI